MAAMCCAARAVTVTATASVPRSSSMKNNNNAGAAVRGAGVVATPTRGVVLRTSAVAEAAADTETSLADSLRPSSADCARTLVEIANTGTISTTCEDGMATHTLDDTKHTTRLSRFILFGTHVT